MSVDIVEARHSKKVQKSGKTTAQVIVEKELDLYPHLIYNPDQFPSTTTRHPETCECPECRDAVIQGILNAMHKKEEATNAPCEADTAGSPYGDFVPCNAGSDARRVS